MAKGKPAARSRRRQAAAPRRAGPKRRRRRVAARLVSRNNITALDRMQGAPINMRGDFRTRNTASITLSGRDLFAVIPDLTTFAAHTVALDRVITVGDFKRLGITARTYQRIKWARVSFELIMQTASTTTGGYAMGVIRDPTDTQQSSFEGYQRFIGNQDIQIAKAWENSCVTLPRRQDWLYTSDDNEPRWYSPGKLVVMIDNKISAIGGATSPPVGASIYATWSVMLKDPTIEANTVTVQALTSSYPLRTIDASTLGLLRADQPYAILAGQTPHGNGITTSVKEIFGGDILTSAAFWQFPQPITLQVATGGDTPSTQRLRVNDIDNLNTLMSKFFTQGGSDECFFAGSAVVAAAKFNQPMTLSVGDFVYFDTSDEAAPIFTQDSGGLKVNDLFQANLLIDEATSNACVVYGGDATAAATAFTARNLTSGNFVTVSTGASAGLSVDANGYVSATDLASLNRLFEGLTGKTVSFPKGGLNEALASMSEATVVAASFVTINLPTIEFTYMDSSKAAPDTLIDIRTANGVEIIGDGAYCVDAIGNRVVRDPSTHFVSSLVFPAGTILTPWYPMDPSAFESVGNKVGTPRYRVSDNHRLWLQDRGVLALQALSDLEAAVQNMRLSSLGRVAPA